MDIFLQLFSSILIPQVVDALDSWKYYEMGRDVKSELNIILIISAIVVILYLIIAFTRSYLEKKRIERKRKADADKDKYEL